MFLPAVPSDPEVTQVKEEGEVDEEDEEDEDEEGQSEEEESVEEEERVEVSRACGGKSLMGQAKRGGDDVRVGLAVEVDTTDWSPTTGGAGCAGGWRRKGE